MAFDIKGFNTIQNMGSPDGAAGTVRNMHSFVTNDTLLQVAAADYFLSVYAVLKVGDVMMVSADVDGTPAGTMYVVATSSSTGVTLTAFA